MKVTPWYHIKYDYFFKVRFTRNLKAISPSSLKVIRSERDTSSFSTKFNDFVTEFSEEKEIITKLSTIDSGEEISYIFSIENNILTEKITCTSDPYNRIELTTHLNEEEQNVFFKHMFKPFGIYLTIYIKHQNGNALNGQHYILNEFKEILTKHSPYSTYCGDYTFIQSKSLDSKNHLGIEAVLDRNPRNNLDNHTGVTLFIYQDDTTKANSSCNNFTVTEDSVKYFFNYTENQSNICKSVLNSLDNANIKYALLYSLFEGNN
ncbi:hypothetical protein O0Q50_19275 [Priestia aryabhattai]|uniref:Uncharacterized protein n=1 Tax=Priestia aryabhattai TaxID=412384 RepID=A0AAX6NC56_PRIAR|nr:hypothetical protein [Priestia aryabhattai]MDU9693316.1 hypothetical protein [Priestia aryabhattai]